MIFHRPSFVNQVVLVIDDDILVSSLTSRVVRNCGAQAVTATNAEEALQKGIVHELVEKFDFFDPLKAS